MLDANGLSEYLVVCLILTVISLFLSFSLSLLTAPMFDSTNRCEECGKSAKTPTAPAKLMAFSTSAWQIELPDAIAKVGDLALVTQAGHQGPHVVGYFSQDMYEPIQDLDLILFMGDPSALLDEVAAFLTSIYTTTIHQML